MTDPRISVRTDTVSNHDGKQLTIIQIRHEGPIKLHLTNSTIPLATARQNWRPGPMIHKMATDWPFHHLTVIEVQRSAETVYEVWGTIEPINSNMFELEDVDND